MAEKTYRFIRDLDGQLGRIELIDDAPVGARDVLTPEGDWIPYYCDGTEITEEQARALAGEWGAEQVDLYGRRKPVPEDAKTSVEKDPYG